MPEAEGPLGGARYRRSAPHAMDQAARAYVASYLAGRNVFLMVADWA
jgi:hypothetical protein